MENPLIFISYNRKDAAFALKLARDLKESGSNTWIDQIDIRKGDRWDKSIEKELKDSTCILIILSPASVTSENVMDEVSYGIECKKRIIPVLTKKCNIPLRLHRFQYTDFTRDYNQGLHELCKELNIENHPQKPPSSLGLKYSISFAVLVLLLLAAFIFKDRVFHKTIVSDNVQQVDSANTAPDTTRKKDTVHMIAPPTPDTSAPAEKKPETQPSAQFYNEGVDLYDKEDYKNAASSFSKALSINSENADAYFYRGVCFYQLDNYNDAISDFTSTIRFSPGNEETYLWRGICYYYIDNYNACVSDLSKFIEGDNSNKNAFLFRGYSNYALKKYTDAVSDFSETIRIDNKTTGAFFMKAEAEIQLGLKTNACADYKSASDLGNTAALAKYNQFCNTPSAAEILDKISVHVKRDYSDKRGSQIAYNYYISADNATLDLIQEVKYVRLHSTFPEYSNNTYQSSTNRASSFTFSGYQWGMIDNVSITLVLKNGTTSLKVTKQITYDN